MNIELTKFTSKWFEEASLAELNNNRDLIYRASLSATVSNADKLICHDLLYKLDEYISIKNS